MISCVRALVCVIQHGTWRGCCAARPMNENTGTGSSPGCSVIAEKSMLRPSMRGGVPVFSRPTGKLQLAQPARETDRRRVARPAALIVLQADVDQPRQERAGRQHHRARCEAHADLRHGAGHAIAVEHQIVDRLLENAQVRLVLEPRADRLPIQHAVGLRARRAHRGPFARVEDPELDAGFVRGGRHRAAQRIDLLDQVAFADAADRRVARHLPQRFDVVRQQQRRAAHARAGQRRLGAGMAAADDDYIIFFNGLGHACRCRCKDRQNSTLKTQVRTGRFVDAKVSRGTSRLLVFHVKHHFPDAEPRENFPSRSSAVNSPVIADSASWASRSSSAKSSSSPALLSRTPSARRRRRAARCRSRARNTVLPSAFPADVEQGA